MYVLLKQSEVESIQKFASDIANIQNAKESNLVEAAKAFVGNKDLKIGIVENSFLNLESSTEVTLMKREHNDQLLYIEISEDLFVSFMKYTRKYVLKFGIVLEKLEPIIKALMDTVKPLKRIFGEAKKDMGLLTEKFDL